MGLPSALETRSHGNMDSGLAIVSGLPRILMNNKGGLLRYSSNAPRYSGPLDGAERVNVCL